MYFQLLLNYMGSFLKTSLRQLKPVEIVFSIYLSLTAIVLVIFNAEIANWYVGIGIRILIALLYALLFIPKKSNISKVVRLFLPFLFIGYFYSETDSFNNLLFASYFDSIIAQTEFWMWNFQPSVEFAKLFNSSVFSELMFFGYFSYYLLVFLLPLFVYFKVSSREGERFSFIILFSFLIYYLLFSVFPVAGPQFYLVAAIDVPNGYLFEPLMRYIQSIGERPTGALPSSHVSICLMLLWQCRKYLPRFLVVVIPVSILMVFSTVYIGAHYALDVLAAFIVTPFLYIISNTVYNKLQLITAKQISYEYQN